MSVTLPTPGENATARALAAPETALDALETARAAILNCRAELASCLHAVQMEAAELREALEASRESLLITQQSLEETIAERNRVREESERQRQTIQQVESDLSAQRDLNRRLRHELLELYHDLRAEDLPTLILRIAMNLTGAEVGLFASGDSTETLAAIGLDDLPPEVSRALYEFTSLAARDTTPLVRNEAQKLPGGLDLVNLAALPVAVQSALSGVILVANKRSGPFTDEDTEMLISIGRHAGLALENQRLHRALGQAYQSTIAVLADAVEAKDPYTRGHSEEVSSIAVQVARMLGWDGDSLDSMRYAALLHDIGKIGIPDGILLKPGKLLPEEFEVIKRHAAIGRDLVSRIPSLQGVAPWILHHHERLDGAGYPQGLSGNDIPLAARIIGVVDALSAMTTPRPYREPVAVEAALEELRRCAGTQFDPEVVNCIVRIYAERGTVITSM